MRNTAWHDCKIGSGDVHKRLLDVVREIEERQYDYHLHNLIYARLYSNRDVPAIDWGTQTRNDTESYGPILTNKENVVKNTVDTVVSSLAKMGVKATPMPRSLNFEARRMARALDRYLYGMHQKIGLKWHIHRLCYDAAIFGTGILKWYPDIKRKIVQAERVMPDEFVVDERQCETALMPREVHRRKLVSRSWLYARLHALGHAKAAKELMAKDSPAREWTSYRDVPEGETILVETHRLPSYPGAGDGRHCMVVDGLDLVDEEWEHDTFPYTFFRWTEPLAGFYGYGLVEEIASYQWRLDDLNDLIERGQRAICIPRILVDHGSEVNVERLQQTDAFEIIKYRGREPKPTNWTAFPPEVYQERERLATKPQRQAGVSEMSSQSSLPAGVRLDSSRAIREFSAIEDRRAALLAQRLEHCYLDAAEQTIRVSEELYAASASPAAEWPRKAFVEQISWKDVRAAKDDFTLVLAASSINNLTPAARYQEVDDLVQRGIIGQEQAAKMYGIPDIEGEIDLVAASVEAIDRAIERIQDGDVPSVDPADNLQLALLRVTAAYKLDRDSEAPEEVLEAYRIYLENLDAELAKAMAPPPGPAQAPEQPASPDEQPV